MQMHTRLLFLLLFAVHLNARSQDSKLAALDSFSLSLVNNVRANEGEQAHLTTDKTIYVAGTPVWFRAFLLRSVADKISTRSKHLFVDLVNEQDSVLLKAVLSAGNQQTSGRLVLPPGVATGYYWLRAYSQSIIGQNPSAAAVVPLYVINPSQPAPANAAKKRVEGKAPVIEMFPEGGNLVTGIGTTLGLFVHDDANDPLLLNGYIKDNRDSVVASFNTNRLGLAKTSFAPNSFRKYHAVITYKDKEYRFPLPAFNRFAGQLAAQTRPGNGLQLRVILEDSIYRKDAVTYLVGLSKDSVCFTGIGYGAYETSIALDKYPKGILSFFLFDKNFRLLSERQVYVKADNLQVGLSMDKPAYRKGSKAVLTVNVLNRLNQPIPASLAVSVADSNTLVGFDEDAALNLVKRAKEAKITNWDLLHNNSLSDDDIDLLLLTSRSHHNYITKGGMQAPPANDSLFYIQGQLLNGKGQPLPNQALSLISRTGSGVFEAATTNALGHFSFPLSPYTDSTQFIIQLDNAKSGLEQSRIILKSFAFPSFQTPLYLKYKPTIPTARQIALLKSYTDTLLADEGSEWLKPVKLNAASRSQIVDPRRRSPSSAILTSAELMRLGTGNIGLGVLRIPGAQLVNGFLRFYGPDQFSGANSNSEPMVLMDGNQISLASGPDATSSPVIQFLNTLNPREIDFIEVLKGPEASMFGIRGGEGVIVINSSKEVHQDFVAKEGNVYKFFRQGYLKPSDFVVEPPAEKRGREPVRTDARATLYWNENELTNDAGKAVFSFFTNDLPGVYKIVVTGITINGDLIYKTHSFVTSLSGAVK